MTMARNDFTTIKAPRAFKKKLKVESAMMDKSMAEYMRMLSDDTATLEEQLRGKKNDKRFGFGF